MNKLWITNSNRILCYSTTVLLCLISVTFGAESKKLTRSLVMADGRYLLRWGFSGQGNGEVITFEVTAQTQGWVGMGISPNGAMKDADIVVSGVNAAGKPYLYDMHADCNCRPTIDKHSDYNLIGGTQNDTHTVVTFSRKVSTCDTEDYPINSQTVRIIWAMHPKDATSSEDFSKHDSLDRGARSTFLLQRTETTAIELPDDVKHFDIVVNDVKIPDDYHTMYWCKVLELPGWGKHHMIKYVPLITKGNEPFLHHIVVYLCSRDMQGLVGMQEECFSRNLSSFSPIHSCQDATFAAWAVGSEGVALPEGFGYPLMEEGTSPYLVMEVHYDNSGLKPTPTLDSSGMRIYMTPTPRAVEYGMFSMGMGVSPETLLIPPGQNDIKMYGICDFQCTRKLPPDGINIASGFLHEHVIGTGVQLRHFRGGKELPPILADMHYDFNYQDQMYRSEPAKILPNDTLVIECTYNSMKNTDPTFGGFGTPEEMCFVFLNYFPKNDGIDNCVSSPHTGSLATAMGTESFGTLQNIFVHPNIGENITIKEFSKLVEWDKAGPGQLRSEKGEFFQQELIKGEFWETCGGKVSKAASNPDQNPSSEDAGKQLAQPQQELLSEPNSKAVNAPSTADDQRDNRLESIETRPRIEELQYDFFFGMRLDLPAVPYSPPDPCLDKKSNSEPESEPEAEPKPDSEVEPKSEPESHPKPEPISKPELKLEIKPVPNPEPKSETTDGKIKNLNDVTKQAATKIRYSIEGGSSTLCSATVLQMLVIATLSIYFMNA